MSEYTECGAHGCTAEPTDLLDIVIEDMEGCEDLPTEVAYCPRHAFDALKNCAYRVQEGESPPYRWLRKLEIVRTVGS